MIIQQDKVMHFCVCLLATLVLGKVEEFVKIVQENGK